MKVAVLLVTQVTYLYDLVTALLNLTQQKSIFA